jgi:hypothetical protein
LIVSDSFIKAEKGETGLHEQQSGNEHATRHTFNFRAELRSRLNSVGLAHADHSSLIDDSNFTAKPRRARMTRRVPGTHTYGMMVAFE